MTVFALNDQLHDLLSEPLACAVEREHSTFDELAAPLKEIVLFGAGNTGRKALSVLRSHGIEPVAFADNAAALWSREIDGLKVLSPSNAAARFGRSAAFVITILDGNFLQIRKQLLELACSRVISFISLFWKYSHECLPYWLIDSPHRTLAQKEDILKAFDLLEDDESRREFVAQVRWRLLQDFDSLPRPSTQDQYFPDDLFTLEANEVFVDCGSFDGDTIRSMLKHCADFGNIVALEPDPANFNRLQQSLSQLPVAVHNRILPLRMGVGAARGKFSFEATGGQGSNFSTKGTIEVQCDALDEILRDRTPTYVKMDVEGAELDTLNGARTIMRRNLAIWAVSTDHKSEDLWRLPLFISAHTNGYHFFLRKYIGEIWDTVYYAVPENRMPQYVPNPRALCAAM
jgi:FkbM family methyltransferase